MFYCFSLLAIISSLSWSCQALDSLGSPTDLMTRVGCDSTIECSAVNATDVQWSISRFSISFVNNSRRATWTTTTDFITTAFLRFTNIMNEDARIYTCFKNRGISTNSITVDVNPNPIEVVASPSYYNLSTTFLGRPLSVSCVVSTCGGSTMVNFTRLASSDSSSTVEETITRVVPSDTDLSFIWNPTVDASLAGDFMCTAVNSLGTANSATFTIAGMPLEPAGNGSISKLMISTTLLVVMLLLSTIANLEVGN